VAISQSLPLWGVYASVILFGVAAFAIPGIMVAAVGDYLPPTAAASVFGTLTVAFGIGQAVGPVVAGAIAERTGGFSAAFVLAAVLAAVGLALSLALRPPAQPASR
jgi:MFS family permease